jgi:hypothetical protein
VSDKTKNLRPFPKGVSGNPRGAALHNQDVKLVRRLTRAELAEVGTFILENDIEKIRELANTKVGAPALRVWIARLVVASMNKGNPAPFTAIMDRIVGKAKEHIHISGEAPVDNYTEEQKANMARAYLTYYESKKLKDVT